VIVARTSTLPKRLQPMLATLTDALFDDKDWVFEDKYDGFRMVATIEGGEVTLYSRNGKIITDSYIEVAKALEGIKHDAVIGKALFTDLPPADKESPDVYSQRNTGAHAE
jgi:bifunctional non-homologous end joining protein LigD